MFEFNLALVVVSLLVLVLGLFSSYIREKTWLSEPMLAMFVGIFAGPFFFNILPQYWSTQDQFLEIVARLTLAIGLMAAALRLPTGYVTRHRRSLSILIGLIMPIMWLVASSILHLLLGIDWTLSLLVGSVITPTDPIVATAIVTGKSAEENLPSNLRNLISAESAANDGLAYPLVLLSYYLLNPPQGSIFAYWLTHTIIWEVVGAVFFGILLGLGAGYLLVWAEEKKLTDKTSFLAYTLILSILVLGLTKLLGTDGILAVFVAGLAFSRKVNGSERSESANIQAAVGQFFILPAFALLGMMLPWQDWLNLKWSALLAAISILIFRRLPFVLLLRKFMPELPKFKDALFLGWFGPIGISAVFYALLIWHLTEEQQIWTIASLMIFFSVVIHGISASPAIKAYAAKKKL
jgi:NhaP-type Na+/H+ or K+/H+ antiporter